MPPKNATGKPSEQTTKSSAAQIDETRTPSVPVTLEQLMNPLGNSGVFIVNGFLEQDYNAKLSGKTGLEVYDKMRKSDATVSALINIITQPIRSTEWFIEPGKNEEGLVTEVEEEQADFVHRALFEKMEQGWDDYMREVCTCLWAGHSVFEKVLKQEDDKVWIKNLAYRRQKTIMRWEQSDGTAGITQITPTPSVQPDGTTKYWIDIPATKLLLFTFNREGQNYEGISLLRAAYKHWYIKDQLYKFDSVRHERQSVGVPYIKLPKGASNDDYNRARTILKNFRAHEMTGLVMPDPEWEFGFCDLKAGDVSDLWKSIEHHNREIMKVGLAQFLELGGTGTRSGSRAVSSDQSGLFIQAIDSVAKMIDDVHSRFLIPELVDLNYDNVYRYPRLQHRRLEKTDLVQLATVMQTLTAAGVLSIDEDLEEWTRKTFDLPPKVADEVLTDEEPQDELPEEEIPEEDAAAITDLGEGDVNPDDIVDPNAPPDGGSTPENADTQIPGADAGETPEGADMTPEEIQAEIDDLEKQLKPNKKAQFYDLEGTIYAEIEGEIYETDGMKFRMPVSDETKKKISEALKRRNGGSGKQIPVSNKKVTNLAQLVGQRRKDRQAKLPKASTGAAQVPLQAQRVKQQQKDPNSPLYQGQAKKGTNSVKKAAKVTSKKATKGKGAKKKSKSATAPKNAKPKGNPREQLQSMRKTIAAAKTPEQKKAAIASLTALKKSMAPHIQSQAQAIDKKSRAATKKSVGKKKAKPVKANEGGPNNGGKGQQDDGFIANPDHSGDEKTANHHGSLRMYSELYDTKPILEAQRTVAVQKFADGPHWRTRKFDEPMTSWRTLTFAEEKINLSALKKALEGGNAKLSQKIDAITQEQKADILLQVKKAVNANDIAKVGKIRAKYTGDLSAALVDVQKQMFEQGMKAAAGEMGVKMPVTGREVKGAMRMQTDKMVDKLSSDMENAAASAVSQVANKKGGSITNTNATEAIAAASDAIDKVIEAKASLQTLSVIGSLNLGRSAIFERYPEQVYAFQYSAIIDDRTTDLCLSLDGRVVQPGSDDFYAFTPPQHYNCRSIWVEILQDEEFKPEIDGIPGSIEPNATIDTAEDLEAPIIKPNSPAMRVLQEELDEREKKLADYQKSGQFPNRQESHASRISDLKKALGDSEDDDGE